MWSRSSNEFRNYFATWENRDWKSCQKSPTSMQRKWHRTNHCYWLTKQKPCWRLTEVRGTLAINTLTLISEETEQLLKDFENDLKLSDSNPISLCPQVTVNGDDLVNMITNLDVKVNHMIQFTVVYNCDSDWIDSSPSSDCNRSGEATIPFHLF